MSIQGPLFLRSLSSQPQILTVKCICKEGDILNVLCYRYRIILVFKILSQVQSSSFDPGHNTVPERAKTHILMELINV